MEIITMVKGKIADEDINAFEEAYDSIKEEPAPEGLVASYLLKDMIDPNIYKVETVWANPETLKKIMGEGSASADIKLFEKFDTDPTVEIYEVRNNFPQYEE
ncbi:hypothetical protein [Methanobacterium lacus]|nr:hypothetical protein [Methanobacterium lacus]